MRRIFLILSIAVSSLCFQCSSSNNNEETELILSKTNDGRFKSEKGNFIVKFKEMTYPVKQTIPIGMKELIAYSYTHYEPRMSRPELVSQVMFMDYPEGSISQLDKNNLLQQMKVNMLSQLGSYKIYEEEAVEQNGHSGLMINAEAQKAGGSIRLAMQIYLVDNRMYQVLIYGVRQLPTDRVNEFFDSFEIIPVKSTDNKT